jgi:hypothetical protein
VSHTILTNGGSIRLATITDKIYVGSFSCGATGSPPSVTNLIQL